ncbi:unnamed protein product [Pylaiella littoralis]
MFLRRENGVAQGLLLVVLYAAGGFFHASSAFCPSFDGSHATPFARHFRTSTPITRRVNSGSSSSSSSSGRNGNSSGRRGLGTARGSRTRLFESIRENREKIDRAMNRLRDAMRSDDEELAERLKEFIMHLRKRDPQFATQDAMDEALEQGLFSTAAKLKLKLADINQNPFRHSLLDSVTSGDESSSSGDISEDMSWGFDQTFFGEEGDGDGGGEPDDYDDI